jgi:hypothetical protein
MVLTFLDPLEGYRSISRAMELKINANKTAAIMVRTASRSIFSPEGSLARHSGFRLS